MLPPPAAEAASHPPVHGAPAGHGTALAPTPAPARVQRPAVDPPGAALAPQPAPPARPDRSLRELEAHFLAAAEKEAQFEIVAEIAGHNDAGAVQALARLFPQGRDPDVKESLLAALADIDPDAAPAARLALLESALAGQPRNVRFTALDVLSHSADPRALAALRRAARQDPDKIIREAAAAMAEALEASEP